MTDITLAQADAIADRTLQKGREMKFHPLTVAILDAGGNLKVLKRSDGASLLRPDIAIGKAWAVLGMGFGGRELARRAEKMPAFFIAMNAMSGGRMVPLPGGALIRDESGEIIGSIGVTGDTSDNDEICLIAGIEAQGLTVDTGDAR